MPAEQPEWPSQPPVSPPAPPPTGPPAPAGGVPEEPFPASDPASGSGEAARGQVSSRARRITVAATAGAAAVLAGVLYLTNSGATDSPTSKDSTSNSDSTADAEPGAGTAPSSDTLPDTSAGELPTPGSGGFIEGPGARPAPPSQMPSGSTRGS